VQRYLWGSRRIFRESSRNLSTTATVALDMEDGSQSDDSYSESEEQEQYLANLEAALEDIEEHDTETLPRRHYFVPGTATEDEGGWGEEIGFNDNSENPDSIDRFLVLPQQDLPVHTPLPASGEPQIDYSRSHILTSNEFVAFLEAKAARKQAILEEAQIRRRAVEENKEMRRLEKLEREKRCKKRVEERAANKKEKEYWEKVKRDGWGDELHELIKSSTDHPSMHVRTPYNLAVPPVCRYNQKIAMLRAKFKKEGKDPRLVTPAMNVEPYMRAMEGFVPLQQSPWFMSTSQPTETPGMSMGNILDDQALGRQAGTYPTTRRF
jgi:hypothetical protein